MEIGLRRRGVFEKTVPGTNPFTALFVTAPLFGLPVVNPVEFVSCGKEDGSGAFLPVHFSTASDLVSTSVGKHGRGSDPITQRLCQAYVLRNWVNQALVFPIRADLNCFAQLSTSLVIWPFGKAWVRWKIPEIQSNGMTLLYEGIRHLCLQITERQGR